MTDDSMKNSNTEEKICLGCGTKIPRYGGWRMTDKQWESRTFCCKECRIRSGLKHGRRNYRVVKEEPEEKREPVGDLTADWRPVWRCNSPRPKLFSRER